MATPVRDGNLIYLFGRQPEQERETPRSLHQEEVPPHLPDEISAHPLDTYLAFLLDRGFITTKELVVLVAALEPMRAHFKSLSTVDFVREELRAKGMTVDALERHEQDVWETTQIFWFDLDAAKQHFRLAPEDEDKHVVFLNEAARATPHHYTDPELLQAETFFWIILRMYRLHAQMMPEDSVDPQTDQKLTEISATTPTPGNSLIGWLAERLIHPWNWRKTP